MPAYDVTVSIQGNMPLNVKACRLNKGFGDTHGEDLQDLKSQDGILSACEGLIRSPWEIKHVLAAACQPSSLLSYLFHYFPNVFYLLSV